MKTKEMLAKLFSQNQDVSWSAFLPSEGLAIRTQTLIKLAPSRSKLPDGYNMLNVKLRVIIIFCIFCSIASVTAQQSAPEKPAKRPLSEVLAPPDSMCINWTDDCRACARSDLGVITCSNVATVCATERIVRCLKRDNPKPSKE